MTLEVKSVRKVVVIGWDVNVVKGSHASIQAEDEEKRNVDNTGVSNIFFPADFTGESDITVVGSKSGREEATLVIE